jgi:SAM-dependent methyltransferase
MSTICPLCKYPGPFRQITDRINRTLNCCDRCSLVFVESQYLLEPDDEKLRYALHNNSIEDEGYVQFLMQAIEPALKFITPNSAGLDYGCGPGPTLNQLLQAKGYACGNYDPLFFPELPAGPFDFVFATECFEHFYTPSKELDQITQLLKPGGYLIAMTSFWNTFEDFAQWHYASDPTHVSFFHQRTFEYIGQTYGFQIVFSDQKRIIILKKRRRQIIGNFTAACKQHTT